jgi:hypothetical protein
MAAAVALAVHQTIVVNRRALVGITGVADFVTFVAQAFPIVEVVAQVTKFLTHRGASIALLGVLTCVMFTRIVFFVVTGSSITLAEQDALVVDRRTLVDIPSVADFVAIMPHALAVVVRVTELA